MNEFTTPTIEILYEGTKIIDDKMEKVTIYSEPIEKEDSQTKKKNKKKKNENKKPK